VKKLWGGRFEGAIDPSFDAFNKSLAFDQRLWREDIRASIAWAHALAGAGVLTTAEASELEKGLRAVAAEIEREPGLLVESEAEDVHSFVESRLGALVGDLAKKLHTGRSRNDQVATDLRLWTKSAVAALERSVVGVQQALVDLAEPNAGLAMPGYTHLQRAQPITVGHHLLAYVEMLERDRSRLGDLVARADRSPLGSGALAGTAFPIDRDALATALGFAGATRNSLDAVSDRDFVAELAFACSLVLVHLSRLSEDWIFFTSQEAGFLHLSDAVATGSSLMPQKKNPDSLELLRGKCGRVAGRVAGLLVTMKGLPLAYDKDLQEDKEALFECVDTTRACLEIAALVVRNARFDADRCRGEAGKGYLNATDLADLLVRSGVPFRVAHERAGATVRAALELGVELEHLPEDARRKLLPELAHLPTADFRRELSVDAVLARRSVLGGTSPARVQAEVSAWKKQLETWNNRS
jgi:argininosuccinate lyase